MIAHVLFCLESYLYSKARNVTHNFTPALHIVFGNYFLCVIVLGNRAHDIETSWKYTFLGYTPNIWKELTSVKRHANTR